MDHHTTMLPIGSAGTPGSMLMCKTPIKCRFTNARERRARRRVSSSGLLLGIRVSLLSRQPFRTYYPIYNYWHSYL